MRFLHLIQNIFLGIGVVVMLVYYTIAAALRYPFDLVRYRKSDFYLETGIPFPAAKDTRDHRLFQEFRAAGLPIRYLPPGDLRRSHGWFLQCGTLILHMFDELSYSEKLRSWVLFSDDTIPMEDSVANQLRLLREVHPDVQIEDIRILIPSIEIDPEVLDRAKQEPTFLIYDYDEGPAAALCRLCA